jgi:hypothetical protein
VSEAEEGARGDGGASADGGRVVDERPVSRVRWPWLLRLNLESSRWFGWVWAVGGLLTMAGIAVLSALYLPDPHRWPLVAFSAVVVLVYVLLLIRLVHPRWRLDFAQYVIPEDDEDADEADGRR